LRYAKAGLEIHIKIIIINNKKKEGMERNEQCRKRQSLGHHFLFFLYIITRDGKRKRKMDSMEDRSIFFQL